MLSSMQRYFLSSLALGPHKQRLLLLAIAGLVISSFALLVLQSTMGGLQYKQIERSKGVHGHSVVELKGEWRSDYLELAQKLLSHFENSGLVVVPEYEIELLARQATMVAPLIVRGLDLRFGTPEFLTEYGELSPDFNMIIGLDAAYKLRVSPGMELRLMSPSQTSAIATHQIPRIITTEIAQHIRTDVPEVDVAQAWVRISLIQNLIRSRQATQLRFWGPVTPDQIETYLNTLESRESLNFITWEEQNQARMWALNLENTVMLFLFVAMTLLVALSITSGLLLFFDRVKKDLASFWILGASRNALDRASAMFLVLMSLFSTMFGMGLGLLSLWLLHQFGGELMPEGFVDRKIPVLIKTSALMVSFFVPFGISLLFSAVTMYQFRRDNDFLETIRSVG
jgi:lipoprotein-releasing system permease protein